MKDIKIALTKAVTRMLHPLVRLLLRYEIPHSEFSELARRTYVDVAYKYFSIPNRKQTYSRVAVITGLSRKEVVRIKKLEEGEEQPKKPPVNRAARVVNGWLQDPDFLDQNGDPMVLQLRGEQPNFEDLAMRYSGDITGRAILDELMRIGLVGKPDKNSVKLLHHGYLPRESNTEMIDVFSTHAADLMTTAIYNMDEEGHDDPRFQRQVTYHDLPESVIKEFEEYSHEKSRALLLDFNKWLARKKKTIKPKTDEATGRVGVGIYFFKNDKLGE